MQTYEVVPNPDNRSGNTPFAIKNNATGKTFGNYYSLSDARGSIELREWEEALPIGLQGSFMLTEVRTVLSRAKTALLFSPVDGAKELNEAIEADLKSVIALLSKYQRTGKTPKYPGRI